MELKRRAFLQRSALLLAALGMSEAGLTALSQRYQQALAQPTRRKLALLVGINQYPEQVCDCVLTRGTALNGCLTDVELQRELLIHRFGFAASDILTLTDQQATRQGIEDAFLHHLIEQARPEDVVVFHFSGLGSQIQEGSTGESGENIQNSLVPIDGVVPTAENPEINDLLEDTLGWLLRSLATNQVTTILDTGYTDLGKAYQGNLRLRSRPNALVGQPCAAELAFQEELLSRTQVSRAQIRKQWRSGQIPGVLLTAARSNQIATEGQWNGFSAGLFTYALTQQLWWTTPATTLRTSLSLAASAVKQTAGIEQQPTLTGQKIQTRLSAYYLTPDTVDAEGVVQAIEEDGKVRIWMAGLPTPVLENYGAAVLTIVPDANPVTLPSTSTDAATPEQAQAPIYLQVRSREGLICRARLRSGDGALVQPGQLVREVVRILPRNIGLTVALDTSLERIERVDAISAFSAIPRVSSVVAGEPADFLFGKNELSTPTLTASLEPTPVLAKRGYGLFSLGRDAIPNTLIQDDEAVKTAVNRITPQLRTLLAIKLLRLTANRGSSHLGVQAILETTAPQERILVQQKTIRFPGQTPDRPNQKPRVYTADLFNGDGSVVLPLESRIRYQLQNLGDFPLYYLLIGLDTSGNPIALFSKDNSIPAKDSVIVPETVSDWMMHGQTGLAETHLIFSRSPFTQSSQVLQAVAKGDNRPVMSLQNPLDVVQAVLQDLHDASLPSLPKVDLPADTYALDVNAWATLSFVYQVIES